MNSCPLPWILFVGSATVYTYFQRKQTQKQLQEESSSSDNETNVDSAAATTKATSAVSSLPSCQVVFVLGAPGSGKGTQCELVERNFPQWVHLSAGDLLRKERRQGGRLGDVINERIMAGQFVPAEITVGCLEKAMAEAYRRNDDCTKFLIDGFPRNQDNVSVWSRQMPHHTVVAVLYFECPEEVLVGRLLDRGRTSGRNDDNLDTIRKRFRTFQQESYPIVQDYEAKAKAMQQQTQTQTTTSNNSDDDDGSSSEAVLVHRIRSDQSIDDVYAKVEQVFVNM